MLIVFNRISRFPLRSILRHTCTMASNVYVRYVDGEEGVQISFDYSHEGGEPNSFNALRPPNEEINKCLQRVAFNVGKRIDKKKKKKKLDPGQVPEFPIVIKAFFHDETEIPEDTETKDALVQGNIVDINGVKLSVELNSPACLGLKIPATVMSGFPIYPKIDLEFADLETSEFIWEKIKYEEDTEAAETKETNSKKHKNDDSEKKIIQCIKVANTFSYTPTNEDIDFYLKLTCIPKTSERVGRPFSVDSKYKTAAGPGPCPFEHRQVYTRTVTGKGEFRVVSYNILADLYADQEYTRTELFPYCPPYALALDYRKPLIIRELTGYNSDIICLQEVDHKVFTRDLQFVFDTQGFGGSFKSKGGVVAEGSAIFFRKSKFSLLDQYDVILKDVLETDPCCADILEKSYAVPALKQVLETRTTALHILALEPVDKPGRMLLVANTHYYFHPSADHVRFIQNLISVRYIEDLLSRHGKKRCSLVFCGDFNSNPKRGIYEFMTTKHLAAPDDIWKEAPTDQTVDGMEFSHDLNLDSACGIVPYTNYTAGFHGMLDYIYYDRDTLEVIQVIPPPDHKDVEFHVALPSIVFPSDHIAQICDFKWNF